MSKHWDHPGDGVWRCLNAGCLRVAVAFRGPTQEEVRREDIAVQCPECHSKRVIFVRTYQREPIPA